MSVLRAAVLLAVLAAPVAAQADRVGAAPVATTLAGALVSHQRPLADDADAQLRATQDYFDYDTLLTLGALALTLGGFAALATRSRETVALPIRIDGAVRGLQSDLMRRFARPSDAA